jgi:activator of 2-hydroxyglutaryl-CoA dehydratase
LSVREIPGEIQIHAAGKCQGSSVRIWAMNSDCPSSATGRYVAFAATASRHLSALRRQVSVAGRPQPDIRGACRFFTIADTKNLRARGARPN